MDKQQETAITTKIIFFLTHILLPIVLGTVVSWARGVVKGKDIPVRHRVALFAAGLSMGVTVHYFSSGWKHEWMLMFLFGSFTMPILEAMYTEFPVIIRNGLRNWLKQAIKFTDDKK